MRSDCCAILLAYQGKHEMLKAIFGSNEEPAVEDLPVFTPDAMRGLSRRV